MAEQMEVLLKADRKPEEEKILGLLGEMSQAEQKEIGRASCRERV